VKRKGNAVIIRVLIILFCCTISTSAGAATPDRIISLAPSITEILYDLGLENNIAAVTDYCDQPPQAKAKPKIGGYANPSLESIVAGRPDLVIMTRETNPGHIRERLNNLGIRTYVFKARQLSELPSAMRELGRFLDVSARAEKKAKALEREIARFGRDAKKERKRNGVTKVMFVIQPEPLIVAGPGTIIDEALGILGLQNIAGKAAMMYPKYSVEEVIRLSPDIIFVGTGHRVKDPSQGLLKKLDSLDAVKKKRVYLVSEALYRLGPRIVIGMDEIADHLRNH
jgi:iron complex transport system substrate-binding protein